MSIKASKLLLLWNNERFPGSYGTCFTGIWKWKELSFNTTMTRKKPVRIVL